GIHVAGDNDLVIRTLNTRTPPQAARLWGWFLKCRHMADKVRVGSWMQTSKAANQGSCSLATAAVESGQTLESTPEYLNLAFPRMPQLLQEGLVEWSNRRGDAQVLLVDPEEQQTKT
ncbi:hypothetical protein PHYSODRAFT_477057, partial [Phytophthora sojae]